MRARLLPSCLLLSLLLPAGAGAAITDCTDAYCQAVTATSGLQSRWPLGDFETDTVGGHNLISLKNMQLVTTGVWGRTDGAMDMQGSSGARLNDADANLYDFLGHAPMSVEFWLRPNQALAAGTAFMGTGSSGWFFSVVTVGGVDYLGFGRTGATVNENCGAGISVPSPGGWHHVVGTYDGSNLQIWMDGQQGQPIGTCPALLANPAPMGIPAGPFALDELAVYNRALSAEEIVAHRTAGIAPGTPLNLQLPSLQGTAAVGQTLTCEPGSWSGDPTPSLSFTWLRSGQPVPEVTGYSYPVTAADIGATLACRVTATNAGGSLSATSAASARVPAQPEQLLRELSFPAKTYVWSKLNRLLTAQLRRCRRVPAGPMRRACQAAARTRRLPALAYTADAGQQVTLRFVRGTRTLAQEDFPVEAGSGRLTPDTSTLRRALRRKGPLQVQVSIDLNGTDTPVKSFALQVRR